MTPFRFTFHVYGGHAHEPGHTTGPSEHYARPEGRELDNRNGPVRVFVENGKKLKIPKVLK